MAGLLPVCFLLASLVVSLFYDGLDLRYYAVAGVLLVLALGAAIGWSASCDWLDVGPAGWFLILLTTWLALSRFWSDIPYLAATQAGVVAAAPVAYLVCRLTTAHRSNRLALLCGLMSVGIGLAAVMLVQVAAGARPEGPYLNINTAAATVNLFVPLLAVLAVYRGVAAKSATLLIVAVAVLATAVGITGGRASALALIGSLIVFCIGSFRWAVKHRLSWVLGAGLVGLTIAHGLHRVFPTAGIRGRGLGHRLATLADPAEAGATRFPIWEATLAMIGERPWLGWGPGAFYQVYPAFRPPVDHTAGFHVHNDYLQYWVEGGLPAFGMVLTLAGVAVWLAWKQLNTRTQAGYDQVAPVAAAAAIAGAGFHAFFSYNLQVMPYLLLLGIAFAALEPKGMRCSLAIPSQTLRRRPIPAATLGSVLLGSAIYFGCVGLSQHHMERGAVLMQLGAYELAAEELHRATAYWSDQDLAHGLGGQVRSRALEAVSGDQTQRRRTLKVQGFNRLDKAVALNPWRPRHHRIRAALHNQTPDRKPEAAEASLRHALELNPRAALARRDLGRLLEDQGRLDEALAVVNAGFGMFYSQNNPIPLMRLGIRLREEAGDKAGAQRLRDQLRARREQRAAHDAVADDVP